MKGKYSMFSNFGLQEILIILLFVLVFFGGAKIPEIARGLRKGIDEFKNPSDDDDKEDKKGSIATDTGANDRGKESGVKSTEGPEK